MLNPRRARLALCLLALCLLALTFLGLASRLPCIRRSPLPDAVQNAAPQESEQVGQAGASVAARRVARSRPRPLLKSGLPRFARC